MYPIHLFFCQPLGVGGTPASLTTPNPHPQGMAELVGLVASVASFIEICAKLGAAS